MYRGTVLKAFVDKHNPRRGVYWPGEDYMSKYLDRMQELAGAGYIEFEAPPEPKRNRKKNEEQKGEPEPPAEE